MNSKAFFMVTLLTVFCIYSTAFAQGEEITLSTYYPAPYGEYEEMAAENLSCDKQIIGNMDVNGDGQFSTPDDIALVNVGNLLVEGRVGIGTTSPRSNLHIDGTSLSAALRITNDNTGRTGSDGLWVGVSQSGESNIWNYENTPLRFATNGAERMRVGEGGNVGIGTTSPQAILDVTSTTSGFLPPRMTTAQRNAISNPPAGSTIYNTTINDMNLYNGVAWQSPGNVKFLSSSGIISNEKVSTMTNFAGWYTSAVFSWTLSELKTKYTEINNEQRDIYALIVAYNVNLFTLPATQWYFASTHNNETLLQPPGYGSGYIIRDIQYFYGQSAFASYAPQPHGISYIIDYNDDDTFTFLMMCGKVPMSQPSNFSGSQNDFRVMVIGYVTR